MSAPIEMAANAAPLPPPQPVSEARPNEAVRERPASEESRKTYVDPAAERSRRVSMASDEQRAARPDDQPADKPAMSIDVMV
jgi:hypothetical protein